MELFVAAALAILGLQFMGVPIAWTWSNYFGACVVGFAFALILSGMQVKAREIVAEIGRHYRIRH